MATQPANNNIAQIEDRSRGKRRNIYDVVFSPFTACFAVFSLALSLFLPTDGLGVTLCLFRSQLEVPCPGCGLTRSVTSISHFEFAKAWDYHPFGPLIYALFIANAILLVVPKSKRIALKDIFSRSDRWLRPVYIVIVLSFFTFGFVRIIFFITQSSGVVVP